MSKPRVHIRLPTDLHERLCREADRPGATKAKIVEAALRAWFNPQSRSTLEERLLQRLDAFDVRQAQIERDGAFIFETLAHYILYWLTRTEPIPEGERDAAHALGRRRYDYFINQVARKIGAGNPHMSGVAAAEPDPNTHSPHGEFDGHYQPEGGRS